jgi:NAD(P)-dependent dehydrogenase (short-subunit alcohol dehydrogenase family)
MARQPRSLSRKVAVVTGAARGVGKATAAALAAQGALVVLGDLEPEATAQAAADIGADAIGMPLDVTDHDSFTMLLDEVERRLGPLDILVNNAGIMPVGPFVEESDAITAREIAVNLHAVVHGTKQALKRMLPRRSGHVVNVASGAGWIAGGGGATYCGTKFGVVGFTESLALELGGSGVDISVVAPTVIKSEMSAGLKAIRGVPSVTPDQVGAAIVDGLQHPRFAIFVPRSMGVMALSFSAVPHSLRHRMARVTRTDKLLLDADRTARAQYDADVAAHVPDPALPASVSN